MNILRALYRNAALGAAPGGAQAGAALQRAIEACESTAWIERNSGTLLFSSLMVRVFGVTRTRGEALCVRNRMTGRVFFLRYPQLYDYMLSKLEEASSRDTLHPALYPLLLVLARLYPSALEGSVSILTLESFAPGVMQCGAGPSLRVRQLAARALPPLLTHALYLSQLRDLFTLLSDRSIKRNVCHGTLLQIIKLLEHGPESLVVDDESRTRLMSLMESSFWILEHGVSELPCYIIVNEYIKLLHVVLWRFTSLLEKKNLNHIKGYLSGLLFDEPKSSINPGRELCLADAVYLLLIINEYDDSDDRSLVNRCLSHDAYEVVLATLNYLLVVNDESDPENDLQEHVKEICDAGTSETLRRDPEYVKVLCEVLKNSKYAECTQKCLLVLTLEPNTQKDIVKARTGLEHVTDEEIVTHYIRYIRNGHENDVHVYLKGLLNFVEEKLDGIPQAKILETLRTTFACSLSDNSDETRTVAAEFLERNLERLLSDGYDELDDADRFEVRASLYAASASLLEDEAPETRERAARAVARLCGVASGSVVSARARRLLVAHVRAREDAVAALAVLALTAFGCEVCLTDALTDECRVFDHNEKYNTNLEEAVWTRECADLINGVGLTDVHRRLCELMGHDAHRRTFEALCGDNAPAFRSIVEENTYVANRNPKVDVFVKRLRRI